MLKKKFGDKITFTTDYVKDGESAPTDTKEILVGLTNRPESSGVRYLDYEIGYKNNRVIVNGGSDSTSSDIKVYINGINKFNIEVFPILLKPNKPPCSP